MLKSVIVATVTRCTRHAWGVIVVALLLTLLSGVYAANHFGINTDINTLISQDLPWRQRELTFEKAFPQHLRSLLIVVDAPTPELTTEATSALVKRLHTNDELFESVPPPAGGELFRKSGVWSLPTTETDK